MVNGKRECERERSMRTGLLRERERERGGGEN